ncbi:MAG: hypothetical protein QOI41_6853, partial [Myxococcales bacterium]|nr:hypothetical protein [Myxococcales bacterium]
MEILVAQTPGRSSGRLGGHPAVPALVGIVAVGVVMAWELVRPTLPVPYELAAAARSPGAASWIGRLPMAGMAVLGTIALYMLLARTAEKRAGVYAVAVLATTPAWFVHGRTMTGAMMPMACSVTILAALGVATLAPGVTTRTRVVGIAIAIAAAALSVIATRWGMPQRGLVSVAGVPAIAVGAASVLWRRAGAGAGAGASARAGAGAGASAGAGVLAVGVVLACGGAVVAFGGDGWFADVLLGTRALSVGRSTFDAPVAAMAYGLVPWTPMVPFALARRPSSAGHLAIMIAAVLAIGAHAALAPRTGSTTIVGVAAIAGAVAAMLRSLEDVRRPAFSLVAAVLAIGWLVAHDVGLAPERVLVAFGASDTAIPAAHAAASSLAIRSSIWLCMALTGVALGVPRAWLPAGRGLAVVAAGVFAGLALRAHAYPELLSRLSPGAAFDAWAKLHRAGEPLGLVGIDRRAVAFAPGTAVAPQIDAPSAGRWLAAAADDSRPRATGQPRRFLALPPAELPRVNAEYRAAHARNVPVLAGIGSTTLLAASALAEGERSDNPFDAIVLGTPPTGLRSLGGAVLDDRLDAVGWQLVDAKGHVIDAIPRGSRSAHIRIVTAVRGGPGSAVNAGGLSGYCTFLHIDHSPSRFSAEHRELPYP